MSSPFTINPAGPVTSTTTYAITEIVYASCPATVFPSSDNIVVDPLANAGDDTNIRACIGITSPFVLLDSLAGNPNPNGVLRDGSGNILANSHSFGPSIVGTFSFTYTDTTGVCADDISTIVVTVSAPPTIPSLNFLETPPFCNDQYSTLIATGGTTSNTTYTWECFTWELTDTSGLALVSFPVRWQPDGANSASINLMINNGCVKDTTYIFPLSPDTASCPQGIFFFAPHGLGVLDPFATWFDWGKIVTTGGVQSFNTSLDPPNGATSQTMFDDDISWYADSLPNSPPEPDYAVRTSRYADGHCATTTRAWVDSTSITQCLQVDSLRPGLVIKIYPNPHIGGALNLEAQGTPTEEALDMELYDLGGRMVLSEQLVVRPLATLRNDLDQLERGLYIMRLRNAQVDQSLKLVLN